MPTKKVPKGYHRTKDGRIANKLKTTKNNFKSFAEAPFQKAEVIVYQTAEDLLE